MLQPELIIADEPVSALGVVRHFCRTVSVMYLGRIVERGPVPAIFNEPLHPYTRALRNASPVPDPKAKVIMAKLEGEVASALSPPTGCHFHPRCPHVMPICREVYPSWVQVAPDRGVACYLYPPGASASATAALAAEDFAGD